MDILELRDYCLSLPEAEETTPFDETTLVYKVGGKMFALTDMVDSGWVAVKAAPSYILELLDKYEGEVTHASHMSKIHWISVKTDGDFPAEFIRKMIESSYLLVVEGLTKMERTKLAGKHKDFFSGVI